MNRLPRRILSSAIAGTLALAMAACSSGEDADAELAGEPIAPIPAPDGQEWNDIVTVSEEGGYIVGNPDAPLKLVEYASHTCGACANFAANGAPSLKKDYVSTGIVSIELRNLVRDPIDLTIAALVRCGQPEIMQPLSDQAWVAFNDVMGGVQANSQAIQAAAGLPPEQRFIAMAEAAGLIDFFAARGLSSDQARSCLADNTKIEEIAQRSQQQSQELGVNSTPTFFLNGQRLEVNQWPGLEPILQQAGAR